LKKDLTNVLTDEIDEELVSRLPEWFIVLRDAYKEKLARAKFET